MTIRVTVTVGLLAAAGLAIMFYGPGLPAALLSAASLAALWWCFIRKSVREQEPPSLPVSCCHYLGDLEEEQKDPSQRDS